MKKILILSGGGAKGNIQASCLAELERNGLLNNIDLYFGSSVGAINAAMLAYGVSAKKLAEIYPELTKKVFKKKRKLFNFPPIYDRQNFIDIFHSLIPKNTLIGEIWHETGLAITAVDLTNKTTKYFKSYSTDDRDRQLVDCICKSFAAPYYFGEIDDDDDEVKYGDGGMAIDNIPVSEAIIEAMGRCWFNEPIQFIIVGCGFTEDVDEYNANKGKGLIYQLKEYMRPAGGGLAREMSRNHQLGYLKALCKNNRNIQLRYYDIAIDAKLNVMDGIDFIEEYRIFGKIASDKPILSIN